MKRMILMTSFVAVATLAACGAPGDSVTRSTVDALGFSPDATQQTGATSARSVVDLLSLS